MAQLQPLALPTTNFNSISSIASEGLNQNFTSVQSIQTKAMIQGLGNQQQQQYQSRDSAYQTGNFNFNTGNISLDRLLEQTLTQELNSHF